MRPFRPRFYFSLVVVAPGPDSGPSTSGKVTWRPTDAPRAAGRPVIMLTVHWVEQRIEGLGLCTRRRSASGETRSYRVVGRRPAAVGHRGRLEASAQ